MTDFLGPANTPNAVIVRPGDSRSFSTADTWQKDCSSPLSNDGTPITAAFLNGFLAQFRNLWRGNGKLADNATPVIAEDGADDFGILKSIQQLFQRGQPTYAVDTGEANAIVVSLVPALKEYKAGVTIRVKIAANNTGATTINVNGLGLRAVKNPDGTDLAADDIFGGGIAELQDDGTRFQLGAKHTDRAGTGGGDDSGTRYRVPYILATGTGTAITATYSPVTPSPQAGDLFSIKLASSITAATTFTPDGHGPYPMVDISGNDLPNGFAFAGDLILMEFDGAKMHIMNKFASAGGFMQPGAIGSIAFSNPHVGGQLFASSTGSAGWPTSNAWQPSPGYIYGAYMVTDEAVVHQTDGSTLVGYGFQTKLFTGVWRILSFIRDYNAAQTDPGLSADWATGTNTAICQRIS